MFGLFKSKERKEKEKEIKAAKKQAHKQEISDVKENARRVRNFKATEKLHPVEFDDIDKQIKLQLNKYEAVVFDYADLKAFEVNEQLSANDPLKVIRLALVFVFDNAKQDNYRVELIDKEMKTTDFKYSVVREHLNKITSKLISINEA